MITVLFCFILIFGSQTVSSAYYDTYSGEVISEGTYLQHVEDNTTFWCVLEADECDPDEWRRIGGACNNLNDPARGAKMTPFYNLLPTVFGENNDPRLSVSGAELPGARKLRTEILATGKVSDATFSNLATHYLLFSIDETNSAHDTVNSVFGYDCCGRDIDNYFCLAQDIPEDDPVFKFTDHRCINMTRQLTYQNQGCIITDTEKPIRVNSEQPLYDLSPVYGDMTTLNKSRLGYGGLIPFEELNGYDWPPQHPTGAICSLNKPELNETRCHDSASEVGGNNFLGMSVNHVWYMRNHNRIARALSELNPTWDDEKLYYTARDINIASYQQQIYYGLFADLMGYENLVADGVLSTSESFRDIYDETLTPALSEEYLLSFRWFHTMVQGDQKLYDRQGNEIGSIKINELNFRTGWYAVDDHFAQITQGAFRQPAASGTDQIIDPEIANDLLRHVQALSDVESNGLAKSRHLGIAPYVDYIKWCFDKTVERFEDLEEFIQPQMIDILKDNYEDVRDIDLLAALWAEKLVDGGYVPKTLYCFAGKHLRYTITSDRHWFERPNRPHAFTQAQLAEIRKTSVSDLLCHIGDGVTEIQPNAWKIISQNNPITDCSEIPTIDFNAWKEGTCMADGTCTIENSGNTVFTSKILNVVLTSMFFLFKTHKILF